MCLAIGSATSTRRTLIGRAWWRIAATPERLLPTGAGVHLLLLFLLATLTGAGAADDFAYTAALALVAIANLTASGLLMRKFSHWAGRSPVHYMLYGSSFALGFGGLLLLELAMLAQPRLLPAAGLLLVAGALLSMHGLRALYAWLRPSRRLAAAAALAGLLLSVLLMAVLAALAL